MGKSIARFWGLCALFALLCLTTAGTWYWYFNNPLSKPADYVSVTGKLQSFTEMGSDDSPFLDVYLQNNPTRFRVDTTAHENFFDHQAFFSNVRPDEKLVVDVREYDLKNPIYPPAHPTPTVFVKGLRDDRMVYSTVEGFRNWETRNRQLGFYTAIFFSVLTGGILATAAIITIFKIPLPTMPPAKKLTIEEDLSFAKGQLFSSGVLFLFWFLARNYFYPQVNIALLAYPIIIGAAGLYKSISCWRQLNKRKRSR